MANDDPFGYVAGPTTRAAHALSTLKHGFDIWNTDVEDSVAVTALAAPDARSVARCHEVDKPVVLLRDRRGRVKGQPNGSPW
jgi:hypothetical protein